MASGAGRRGGEGVSAAVRAYGPALRAFIRRRVDDLGDAEDLAQEVPAEFVAATRLLQPIEQAAAWQIELDA